MLRIEKVFLQGFKSFCDPTDVLFDAEGITAVVGPNGCGKSNVADALNWVIGEQRAKALRGGKMEDVIFQGSRNRQPSGLAEVVLTLRVSETFEIRAEEKVKEEIHTSPIDFEKFGSELIGNNEVLIANTLSDSPLSDKQSEKKLRTIPKIINHVYEAGERISIARRLYRTGESEYEMNGRTCRLRDIQDLFAGTGLGASHYAIIEQGRIGQVLSAKPYDRRALIEEAAGISKFKHRQRAAESKLEAAKLNLSRITDILAEVERQTNSLKRQAAKARRFQRLRDEMRSLMRAVYVADFNSINEKLLNLADGRINASTNEQELVSGLANAEASKVGLNLQVEESEGRLLESRNSVSEKNLFIQKARQQKTYLEEQLHSLKRRLDDSARDKVAISERRELTEQETERLKAQLISIEQEINQESTSLSDVEKEFQQQSLADRTIEAALTEAQARRTENATLRERWRPLVRQFTEACERCQRQIEGLEIERERASNQSRSLTSEAQKSAENIGEIEIKHLELSTALTGITSIIAQLSSDEQVTQQGLAELRNKLTAAEQRLKSLQELDDQKAYYSEAVQAITREIKNRNGNAPFKILGTLADHIKVKADLEKIVEAGLREEMQYLLAPTFEDAVNAIEFLKAGKHGRATFLILEKRAATVSANRQPSTNPDVVHLLDVLGLKPEITEIIRHALPRISDTFLAQEIHSAIQNSIQSNGKGSSFLTTTGEFISAGRIISGGSTAEQSIGVLGLKREIAELLEKVEQLNSSFEAQQESLLNLKTKLSTSTQERSQLDAQFRQTEKDLAVQRGLEQQLRRELERANHHLTIIEKEKQQGANELSEFKAKLTHAESELLKAETQLIEAEQIAEASQASVLQMREKSQERAQELSRRRADFAAKSERRKALQNEIRRLENESQDISQRLSRSQMDALEAEETTASLYETLQRISQSILIEDEELAQFSIETETLALELAQKKELLTKTEKELAQLRDGITKTRESLSQIEISKTKFATDLDHLKSTCYVDLGDPLEELVARYEEYLATANSDELPVIKVMELDEVVSDDDELMLNDLDENITGSFFPAGFELESGKLRLADLKQKIENLGPVNLLALEELGELEQRFIFLVEQKADIETAIADTLAAINEIKNRSREKFVEAFRQINKNFTEMFLELFGGGHGEMRLIDETDVLESGIDIIAQPPGKRLQNVLLLSGGEKAMAAMALVLGIFKYRPSPFCLLDEVDAPLDEVNIGRFADKILEMSSSTQFMIITHSKRTMEAAKTLYGVTMEDPGISKLISVKLT